MAKKESRGRTLPVVNGVEEYRTCGAGVFHFYFLVRTAGKQRHRQVLESVCKCLREGRRDLFGNSPAPGHFEGFEHLKEQRFVFEGTPPGCTASPAIGTPTSGRPRPERSFAG